jgi:hypothetical protein
MKRVRDKVRVAMAMLKLAEDSLVQMETGSYDAEQTAHRLELVCVDLAMANAASVEAIVLVSAHVIRADKRAQLALGNNQPDP